MKPAQNNLSTKPVLTVAIVRRIVKELRVLDERPHKFQIPVQPNSIMERLLAVRTESPKAGGVRSAEES